MIYSGCHDDSRRCCLNDTKWEEGGTKSSRCRSKPRVEACVTYIAGRILLVGVGSPGGGRRVNPHGDFINLRPITFNLMRKPSIDSSVRTNRMSKIWGLEQIRMPSRGRRYAEPSEKAEPRASVEGKRLRERGICCSRGASQRVNTGSSS